MSFCQNLFSTFIGVLLGFIFSIVLFYFQQRWLKNTQKKTLEKNVIKELEFNGQYLGMILSDLRKTIEKITVNDRNVFYFFNYMSYQRLFISAYFQQGYLYEILDSVEITLIETILNRLSVGGQNYINNSIQSWKNNLLDQVQILNILTFERDSIEKYIGDIDRLKNKIDTKKAGA